jgi:hypothetical protein
MPIITREQLITLSGFLFFCLIGIILYQILNHSGKLNHFPDYFIKKKWVQINLKGAVSKEGERKVSANASLWQVISSQNQWNSYVNWTKVPLASQPFHGMEYQVPFRVLRAGEVMEINEIIVSQGKLLNCIPCFEKKGFLLGKISNREEFIKFSKNLKKYACFKKYINGI